MKWNKKSSKPCSNEFLKMCWLTLSEKPQLWRVKDNSPLAFHFNYLWQQFEDFRHLWNAKKYSSVSNIFTRNLLSVVNWYSGQVLSTLSDSEGTVKWARIHFRDWSKAFRYFSQKNRKDGFINIHINIYGKTYVPVWYYINALLNNL